jgi:hypothetical protein
LKRNVGRAGAPALTRVFTPSVMMAEPSNWLAS